MLRAGRGADLMRLHRHQGAHGLSELDDVLLPSPCTLTMVPSVPAGITWPSSVTASVSNTTSSRS